MLPPYRPQNSISFYAIGLMTVFYLSTCRFLDPLMFGDYPTSMRDRVGERMPTFTSAETDLIKGSLDFVGINHYTTFYASDNSSSIVGKITDIFTDSGTITLRKYPHCKVFMIKIPF